MHVFNLKYPLSFPSSSKGVIPDILLVGSAWEDLIQSIWMSKMMICLLLLYKLLEEDLLVISNDFLLRVYHLFLPNAVNQATAALPWVGIGRSNWNISFQALLILYDFYDLIEQRYTVIIASRRNDSGQGRTNDVAALVDEVNRLLQYHSSRVAVSPTGGIRGGIRGRSAIMNSNDMGVGSSSSESQRLKLEAVMKKCSSFLVSYSSRLSNPTSLLSFAMKQHGLLQSDRLKVFKQQSSQQQQRQIDRGISWLDSLDVSIVDMMGEVFYVDSKAAGQVIQNLTASPLSATSSLVNRNDRILHFVLDHNNRNGESEFMQSLKGLVDQHPGRSYLVTGIEKRDSAVEFSRGLLATPQQSAFFAPSSFNSPRQLQASQSVRAMEATIVREEVAGERDFAEQLVYQLFPQQGGAGANLNQVTKDQLLQATRVFMSQGIYSYLDLLELSSSLLPPSPGSPSLKDY
jgi:hypothetical protein